jgi:WhiB family redox-sensing transcriptional regulator
MARFKGAPAGRFVFAVATCATATVEWLMAPAGEPDPWACLEEITRRPAWQSDAACRGIGPAAFFPARGGDSKAAVAICEGCQVVSECRDYAVADPDIAGMWGGTSHRERRLMRRNKRPDPEHGWRDQRSQAKAIRSYTTTVREVSVGGISERTWVDTSGLCTTSPSVEVN